MTEVEIYDETAEKLENIADLLYTTIPEVIDALLVYKNQLLADNGYSIVEGGDNNNKDF